MVRVLASSALDHWFEPRSGQTKDYTIGICCCFSARHAIRTMCQNGVTCLSADCCFSELFKKNPTKRVGLLQSIPHHHLIEN